MHRCGPKKNTCSTRQSTRSCRGCRARRRRRARAGWAGVVVRAVAAWQHCAGETAELEEAYAHGVDPGPWGRLCGREERPPRLAADGDARQSTNGPSRYRRRSARERASRHLETRWARSPLLPQGREKGSGDEGRLALRTHTMKRRSLDSDGLCLTRFLSTKPIDDFAHTLTIEAARRLHASHSRKRGAPVGLSTTEPTGKSTTRIVSNG